MRWMLLTMPLFAALGYGGVGIDLAGMSLGTWVSLNNNLGPGAKDAYFSNGSLYAYFHGFGLKGAFFLPVAWTVERYEIGTRYAVYPADFHFYLGRRFGPLEPRLGLSLPLDYPTDGSAAWIGSGNLDLLLGLGFSGGGHFHKKLATGGELQASYSLNGIEEGARFAKGSVSGYASVKAGWAFSRRIQAGLVLFGKAGYFPAVDWEPDRDWTSYGILPMAFVRISPGKKLDLSLKGGAGRENGNGHWSALISAGLAVNYYPW